MTAMTRILALALLSAAAGLACACTAAPPRAPLASEKMVVLAFRDAEFVPADPTRPDGAQLAVLWGDPARGPSAMLLRFKKAVGRLHYHNADYHLVLLQGTMKHWAEAGGEAAAPELGPGSYWFQPGKQVHGDACLSDECLMFVNWAGKRDSVVPESAR